MDNNIPVRIMKETGRIRIAVVGLGFGRHIVNELLGPGGCAEMELAGICDADPARLAECAAASGVRSYRTLEEILADESIEAVGLYTPPHRRAELIGKILRAGKHAMTTKPFEDDPRAAAEALELARNLQLVVHLNSPSPLPAADQRMILQWRDEFDLGEPVSAFWETYACYHETADGSWMDDPVRCPAAPLFRLGIYGINDLVELCGEPISCHITQSRTSTGRPTADNAMLTISFANGALGCVAASFRIGDGRPYSNRLLMHYERGTIWRALPRDPDGVCQLALLARGREGEPISREGEISVAEHSGSYQWKEFRRAIRERSSITPEYARRIVCSIELVNSFTRQCQAPENQLK